MTIDWTVRESDRARIRVMVRRILHKHGYPPDLQEEATKTVLEQAELLCADWAGVNTPGGMICRLARGSLPGRVTDIVSVKMSRCRVIIRPAMLDFAV